MDDNIIDLNAIKGNDTKEAKDEWVRKAKKAFIHVFTTQSDYDQTYVAEICFHALYEMLVAMPTNKNMGNIFALIDNIDEKVKEWEQANVL